MTRKELIEEIVDFCIEYDMVNIIGRNSEEKPLLMKRVEKQLSYNRFVEYLIFELLLEAKYIDGMDNERLENLLRELGKI